MSWECGRVVGAGGAMCCAYNIVMKLHGAITDKVTKSAPS